MPRHRRQAPRHDDDLLEAEPREPADTEGTDAGNRPSKSALKRQAHELQRLGDELLALKPEQLASVPIDEKLRDAIELGRRIKSREALRRQRQLIGKLMRDADAHAIREALDAASAGHRAEVALARAAEDWRERLLSDDTALAAFIRRFGAQADETALARCVGQARAERAASRSGGAYRNLYRSLLAAMRDHQAGAGEWHAHHPPQHPPEQP